MGSAVAGNACPEAEPAAPAGTHARVTGPVTRDGVTIVMPAYREEQTLATTVADFLHVPEAAGVPHCVVVVNDGSTDDTEMALARLRTQYPDLVTLTHSRELAIAHVMLLKE